MLALAGCSALAQAQSAATTLNYTGDSFVRSVGLQPVSAVLTDSLQGLPVPSETVSFTMNGVSVSATTDQNGVASTSFDFDPDLPQPTGSGQVQVSFAGDSNFQGSTASATVEVFQGQNFVIWGGNSTPPQVGDRVNFWGAQWAGQVTGGEYGANPSFKGFANHVQLTRLVPCQATATVGTLTTACWQTKPGNSFPPATLPNTIEVIVSTAIVKSGNNIFGNVSRCALVRVDQTAGYANDPGHPGFGTIIRFNACEAGGGGGAA